MKTFRNGILTSLLASLVLIASGCNSDNTTSSSPPGDASKAYKSSDEAAKDMMKNSTLPPKR